ncbi:Glycine cleavage system transcriptional activator [compost metagenome]
MMTAAATAGLGIGLAPRLLIERELETGQLVIPVERVLDVSQGYYFAYPEDGPHAPALDAFRDWVLGLSPDTAREP